jgi:nucleoside phosphorylase
MIGLIFATLQEARPFLSISRAVRIEDQPFVVYSTPDHAQLRIAICRIGKVAAAAACQALILSHKAERIINAGACGALHDRPELAVGSLVRVTEAVEGDHEVFGKRPKATICAAGIGNGLPPARLVTCDRPVFDPIQRKIHGILADVVDMEGAAVARVAELYGVPCEMIKGVTDNALALDRKTLLENLNMVCEQIAQWLWKALAGDPAVQ